MDGMTVLEDVETVEGGFGRLTSLPAALVPFLVSRIVVVDGQGQSRVPTTMRSSKDHLYKAMRNEENAHRGKSSEAQAASAFRKALQDKIVSRSVRG